MPDPNELQNLLRELTTHRATLAIVLQQRANLGADHAPPGVHHAIADARAAIARLKAALRDAGVTVEDQHNDTEPDDLLPSLQPAIPLPNLFPIANDLIGRAAERTQLGSWFDALAQDRHGRIGFITAPPGFGTRALLNALVDDVRADGGVALHARFWPTDRADADTIDALWNDDPLLDPAVAAIEPQLRAAWPSAARLGGRGWVRVVAQLAQALGSVPTPQATRLPDDPTALKGLVRLAARGRGLLLALETLDAADDLWIDLIRDLAPEIARDLPVLLVASLNVPAPLDQLADAEMTEARHLVKTLYTAGEAAQLHLAPLTPRDVAEYVGDIDAELARRLVAISDGVSVIAEALWAAWLAEGVVAPDDAGVWQVADAGRGWVFGNLRDRPLQLLKARLPADAPLTLAQVDALLGLAALEGPTFTVQAVARALNHDPDTVLELLDTYLLEDDDTPGLLVDGGFVEMPGVPAAGRPYLLRFAAPHLWQLWAKYGLPECERAAQQGRLAEALELVYHGATNQIAGRLAALFVASGQPARAEPYQRRVIHSADLVVTLWQIALLERQARDPFDDYRLFELRIIASDQLCAAGRYAEGAALARAALAQAKAWRSPLREARAANMLGMHLHAQGDYAAARPLYGRAGDT